MRLILFCISILLSSCGISNPFDDNIAYKTRFDDGLAFFEEENYVKASQQFNIIVDRASHTCLLYTSPSPRDRTRSRMPSSA